MDEESCLFKKIKSKYIIENYIIQYTEQSIFYNLFKYSKYFQAKFNLDYNSFSGKLYATKNVYLGSFWENLLSDYYSKDKSLLKSIYIICNNNEEIFKRRLFDYFNYLLVKYNVKREIDKYKINKILFLDSNYFNYFIDNKILEKMLTIKILGNEIKENNLKSNKYYLKFSELNEKNINYQSIEFTTNTEHHNDIKDLEAINIDFNKIKEIILKGFIPQNVEKLFYFNNIKTNLVYLGMNFFSERNEISSNLFENINELKGLKYLSLECMKFKGPFILKLNGLIDLSLKSCDNIIFEDDIFLNLEKISLNDVTNVKSSINNLLKCPELKECYLIQKYKYDKTYDSIFDFSSFKNLNIYIGIPYYFLILEKFLLHKVDITELNNLIEFHLKISNLETERNILKKICSNQELKTIGIRLAKINSKEISEIKGENLSITRMELKWNYSSDGHNISEFQKKFPNLSQLSINIAYEKDLDYNNEYKLEIIDNPHCKIEILNIIIYSYFNTKLYCHYKKLKYISIKMHDNIEPKHILPIFNKKCDAVFESLLTFIFYFFSEYFIDADCLENLYNNIDKMPNLILFQLKCFVKNEISETFFHNFLLKLFTLKKIKCIDINIKCQDCLDEDNLYERNELESLFPKINFSKFEFIKIARIQKKQNINKRKNKKCIII